MRLPVVFLTFITYQADWVVKSILFLQFITTLVVTGIIFYTFTGGRFSIAIPGEYEVC
ncbi:MAG: hypothetical protein U0X91_12755 [Spirosomataceae bacterium]